MCARGLWVVFDLMRKAAWPQQCFLLCMHTCAHFLFDDNCTCVPALRSLPCFETSPYSLRWPMCKAAAKHAKPPMPLALPRRHACCAPRTKAALAPAARLAASLTGAAP